MSGGGGTVTEQFKQETKLASRNVYMMMTTGRLNDTITETIVL